MTAATSITVRVPLEIRHRRGRKTVVTPMADGAAPVMTRADPALVKALARAFRYQRMLDQGRYASITEMAGAERIERGYLGSLLRLTLLAPDIIEAILDGRQPVPMTCTSLLGGVPDAWTAQTEAFIGQNPSLVLPSSNHRQKPPPHNCRPQQKKWSSRYRPANGH
ncbi:hypothetical protein ACI6QG_06460 [Roseococcus sp. DSY-14]|uniref:hypothetical protein n=1 Tax=Roseococcus sp. DSY-14 TaxID=3369650 RepID=UPI00387AC16F